MIVLDAHVLIGFLDPTDPHHGFTRALRERHVAGGYASNVLSIAEALVHPTRAGIQDAAQASLETIIVQIIGVDPGEARTLASVRNTHRLRTPDAVALHTALTSGSPPATFDEALAAAATRAGVSLAI